MSRKQIGLYIHVPFCKAKCHYCDFNSFACKESMIPQYFDALKKEIYMISEKVKDCSIKSVFIGGGTPSYVDGIFIDEIMKICKNAYELEKDAEISLEANPGTLSVEKLETYLKAGINRLSIGFQAWQKQLLKKLGRIHSQEDFVRNFKEAQRAGFKNINVDLIFGVPGQSLQQWIETVENVVAMGPSHLSCYSLKIEEGTVFDKKVESGELVPVEDELDREMYYQAIEILSRKGFRHYEISNFALPGSECRHNLIYWNAQEYLGLGAGAHSYFKNKRFSNTCGIDEYISKISAGIIPSENIEQISLEDSQSEFVILGLRLTEGIDVSVFKQRYGKDIFTVYPEQIDKLLQESMLELYGTKLRLTAKGLDLANQVFMEFI